MRKLNHPQQHDSVSATVLPQVVASWLPRTGVQTAVIDPAYWSQRTRQLRRWQFIEARRSRMH